MWVGWCIYFNLWNYHGWSPLQWGWLCPESTHLAGGPNTANKPAWPLPSSQVSLPTANGDTKTEHQSPEMTRLLSIASLSYTAKSTCPRGGVVTPESQYTLLCHSQTIPELYCFHEVMVLRVQLKRNYPTVSCCGSGLAWSCTVLRPCFGMIWLCGLAIKAWKEF